MKAYKWNIVECYMWQWLISSWVRLGTIPPIKSPLEKNDDVKKLFSIGCPVILVTLGVALLFIIRKKRKEKRLKRLRGKEKSERSRSQVIGMNWQEEQSRMQRGSWMKSHKFNLFWGIGLFIWKKSFIMFASLFRCQKSGRDADKVRLLLLYWKSEILFICLKIISKILTLQNFLNCECLSCIAGLVKTTGALTPRWRGPLRAHGYTSTFPECSCWSKTKKASSKLVRGSERDRQRELLCVFACLCMSIGSNRLSLKCIMKIGRH